VDVNYLFAVNVSCIHLKTQKYTGSVLVTSKHNINTRNKHRLHRPNARLSFFQKLNSMLTSGFSTICHSVPQNRPERQDEKKH